MKTVTLSLERLSSNKGYIDPSVMTIAIQAIAGVVIAVGAAVGIHFRKAKKKLAEKLNIDENKNKEVEGDDIIINDAPETVEKEAETVDE